MFETLITVAVVLLVWRYAHRDAERKAQLEREAVREQERARQQARVRQREASRRADLLARRPDILEEARLGRMHAGQLRQVLDNARGPKTGAGEALATNRRRRT